MFLNRDSKQLSFPCQSKESPSTTTNEIITDIQTHSTPDVEIVEPTWNESRVWKYEYRNAWAWESAFWWVWEYRHVWE